MQNGGLGNDVSQEELLSLFSVHGNIDGIIMLPRKPYAFVCFSDTESSSKAKLALQGHVLRQTDNAISSVVLFLFFVEKGKTANFSHLVLFF